ncbi:hypothetical protein H0H93_005043 [Arthromyces matolae]|nr:hypothetical protein H0H93_005043 [Arthromyces matolae]
MQNENGAPHNQIEPSRNGMEVDNDNPAPSSSGGATAGISDASGSEPQTHSGQPVPQSVNNRDVMINNFRTISTQAASTTFDQRLPALIEELDRRTDAKILELKTALQPSIDSLAATITAAAQVDEDPPQVDEDEEMGDGSDESSSASASSTSKSVKRILTIILLAYLDKHKLVCHDLNGLPIRDSMPLCALGEQVEGFANRIHDGPTLEGSLLYYWPLSLYKTPWNKALTKLLARDFLNKLEAGRIKHQGNVVAHEPSITEQVLIKTIPKRLRSTRRHWMDEEKRRVSQQDISTPSPAAKEKASAKARTTRRNNRAKRLLEERLQYIKKYYDGRPIQVPLTSMLKKLGPKGMNSPISDDEGDDPKYHSTRHLWIEPDISQVLEEIDRQMKHTKARLLTKQAGRRKGNKPISIQGPPIVVTDSEATTKLPRNWYHREWYNGRSAVDRMELAAEAEVEYPVLTELRTIYDQMVSS